MDTSEYERVNSSGYDGASSKRRHFLRQLLVMSGAWSLFFTHGLCHGATTVIIPQLRREANSTAAVSDEMVSWMSSIQGYAAIPWIVMLPIFTERRGRKQPFMFVSLCSLFSFIVFMFSSSVGHVLAGEVLQSMIGAFICMINIVIVSEYSSAKYRGLFLTIKSASYTWGVWCSNALGTFFHWKKIAILGILTSVFCIVTSFFWTESPLWLASRGRFEKCRQSHRWLKGSNADSEKELAAMIESQKQYIEDSKNNTSKNVVKNIVFDRNFYKPVLLCVTVLSSYHFSGKLVFAVYALDIIKKITGEETAAYTGMLVLDGFSVLGMYIGCVLCLFLRRRSLLLFGSTIGILFLYLMSLYLYLIKLDVLVENSYVSISLLSVFSIAICCGPILMSTAIYGEILPLRFRSISMFVIGLYNVTLFGTLMKLSPYMFRYFKLHGGFLFYSVMSTICTVLLYFYLPETKDKTLDEIGDNIIRNTEMLGAKERMLSKSREVPRARTRTRSKSVDEEQDC